MTTGRALSRSLSEKRAEVERRLRSVSSEYEKVEEQLGQVLTAEARLWSEFAAVQIAEASALPRQIEALLDDRRRKIEARSRAVSEAEGRVQALSSERRKLAEADEEARTALEEARRKAAAVGMEDFNNAIERIVAGLEKRNRLLNPKEREVVAYHEMGHALAALAVPGSDPVHKVSIIPRGIGALGYTIQRPTEDRFLMTREELENKMAVLLGGRAAETVMFGHLSTGAADDLMKVTDIARAMVTRYGMTERLGHVALEKDRRSFLATDQPWYGPQERDYSDETAAAVDEEVRLIVERAFARTVKLLRERRGTLEKSARLLLERETLDEGELASLFAQAGTPGPGAA